MTVIDDHDDICRFDGREAVGKKRVYTLQDVDTFRKIRDYSKQGRNLDAIEAELRVFKPKVKPTEEKGLIIHPEVLKVLQEINAQNVALQLQVDKLQAQVNWLMLPWWKRVGKDMPGVEKQENR